MSTTVLYLTLALEIGLLAGYCLHAGETWINHGRQMALSFANAIGANHG